MIKNTHVINIAPLLHLDVIEDYRKNLWKSKELYVMYGTVSAKVVKTCKRIKISRGYSLDST